MSHATMKHDMPLQITHGQFRFCHAAVFVPLTCPKSVTNSQCPCFLGQGYANATDDISSIEVIQVKNRGGNAGLQRNNFVHILDF